MQIGAKNLYVELAYCHGSQSPCFWMAWWPPKVCQVGSSKDVFYLCLITNFIFSFIHKLKNKHPQTDSP